MTIVASLLLLLLLLVTTCCFYDDIIPTVSAHGYLKTPRSRNLVACKFVCVCALYFTCLFVLPIISISSLPRTLPLDSHNTIQYNEQPTDQDKNWETYLSGGGTSNDPSPEDCPHCLNRGGILAQCVTNN